MSLRRDLTQLLFVGQNRALTYVIADGAAGNMFTVNSSTGQIWTAAKLDREIKQQWIITGLCISCNAIKCNPVHCNGLCYVCDIMLCRLTASCYVALMLYDVAYLWLHLICINYEKC